MRHILSPLLIVLAFGVLPAADFFPKPKIPDVPAPTSVPDLSAVTGGNQSQPAPETEKKPAYIYQYYNDPGDIEFNCKKLSEEQCTRIIAKAKVLIKTEDIYREKMADRRKMEGSVHSLKGFILEELYFTSDNFTLTMTKAKQAAAGEGIPEDQVVLARETFGRMPVEDAVALATSMADGETAEEKLSGWCELTDGLILAIFARPAGGSDEDNAAFDARIKRYEKWGAQAGQDRYVRILGVIESKTPKEHVKLVKGPKGTLGQFEKDYGRLSTYTLKVGDQEFGPGQIIVAKEGTSWTAVLPRDYRTSFKEGSFAGIFKRFDLLDEFAFVLHEGPVSNSSAVLVAENVYHCIYEKDLFANVPPRVEE